MGLYDAINIYKSTKNWKVKRAMLMACNAMYREEMGLEPPVSESTPDYVPTPTKPRKTIDEMRNMGYKLTSEEVDAGVYHGKITCIKLFRARNGESLINAKDFVEWFFDYYNYTFKQW